MLKQQRGLISDGWLKVIAVVVVLVLIYAIFQAIAGYLDDVDAKAYARGKADAVTAYEKRDNDALRKANARIQELQDQARAIEREHAKKLAAIAAERAKEKADAQKQKDADADAVRSGDIRLRDPGSRAVCAAPRGGGAAGKAAAGAGGGDGEEGAYLSKEAARFLLELVNEADDVARQLARAQQVIAEQIQTCNNAAPLGDRVTASPSRE